MTHHMNGAGLAALRRWRRVVAPRPREGCGLAALTFQTRGPIEPLVPLENISAVVLSVEATKFGPTRIRFSLYAASPIRFGVQWGAAENCQLSKNLRLRPRMQAKGRRFDLTRVRLLHTAINLFETVCQAEDQNVVDHLQLPQAWAGFAPSHPVAGDGPELLGLVHQLGPSSNELMERSRRIHESHVLYPVEFASHEWEYARLYVEPSTVPALQVIRCDGSEEALEGFRGAAAFDFITDVFRVPLVSCSGHPV